jgi:hypothetical protein
MRAGVGETVKLGEFKVAKICGIFVGIRLEICPDRLHCRILPENRRF